MPEATGVQFFEEIAQLYPEPIRMLLTGYVDIESVIAAINRGHIFRYLTKPYQVADIHAAIEQGYRYYTATSMLQAKNNELQKANADLDKFVYSVTHDIRGPIVSMLGALTIMKGSEDIDEMKLIVEMMEESATQMNDLIENIHSYYNLKRGNIIVEEIDFNLLVKEILYLHTVNTSMNKIRVIADVCQEVSYKNDKVLVQLIINNLLSNAVKYQKKEEENKFAAIEVLVTNAIVKIVVKDNGIGIEEQHIDSIFNMFFRATNENTGSGFGLYNVQDALLKLNGEINVKSVNGAGTEFTVIIPGK